MGRSMVFAVLVLAAGSAPAAGQAEEAAGAEELAEVYVPADARFPPGLIDWAERYANPVLEVEPAAFGTVAFERRSFERSVASIVLVAVSALGVYVGMRSGLRGNGWAGAVAVAAPSGIGVAAGVQGFTRWSKVPAVRRMGWLAGVRCAAAGVRRLYRRRRRPQAPSLPICLRRFFEGLFSVSPGVSSKCRLRTVRVRGWRRARDACA